MKVTAINDSLDISSIRNILTSQKVTNSEKVRFIQDNIVHLQKSVTSAPITGKEFKLLMHNRPLIKFRFLKNSITKRGDKRLLAETLDIEPVDVESYINNVCDVIIERGESSLPKDQTEAVKTYVYRHGKKDQVVAFLSYELSHAKDILETLYNTLSYNTEGLADYFSRPVHRMSNKTMLQLYDVIDQQLRAAVKAGTVEEINADETAKWALVKIYEIQNNSKLINAVKAYKTLTS